MNIVLDAGLELNDAQLSALKPLIKEGQKVLSLDSIEGLNGTPNDEEPIVFISNVSTDVLRHHSVFFKQNLDCPQWFFIFVNDQLRGNRGIIGVFKDASLKYGILNSEFYSAPNNEAFEETVKTILNKPIRKKGKVLFFTKHKRDDITWIAENLLDGDNSRCDFAFAGANYIDSAKKTQTDAAQLFFCGSDEKDFKDVDNLPENMEPYFVFLYPEKRIQLYLNPEELIKLIGEEFHMAEARVKQRLFFVSDAADLWMKDRSEGQQALEKGVIMIDKFGLPVSRSEYTEDKIAEYIENGYFDQKRFQKVLNKK